MLQCLKYAEYDGDAAAPDARSYGAAIALERRRCIVRLNNSWILYNRTNIKMNVIALNTKSREQMVQNAIIRKHPDIRQSKQQLRTMGARC
jgi:hypothetical protein